MIKIATPVLGEEELANLEQCIKTGWISSAGPFVSEFEERVACLSGCAFGIATSSGTTALHLSLAALDLQPDEEVLVPCLTFVATASTVLMVGARPVLCDVDPSTWCLDPAELARRCTSRTKGIMAVHLYGHPCDMKPIKEFAEQNGLWILEDAAEALGARYRDEPVGNFGKAAVFSFFANKTITTGEGGMMVTGDAELAKRARLLRDHGMAPDKRYWYDVVGFNYRMTNLQAAIGCAQLSRFEEFLLTKRSLAKQYRAAFVDLEGLQTPREMPWAFHGYWMYTILIGPEAPMTRDELADFLHERGIETRRVFYPLHMLPPYRQAASFPVSQRISDQGLSLPSGNGLTSKECQEVIETIRGLWRGN